MDRIEMGEWGHKVDAETVRVRLEIDWEERTQKRLLASGIDPADGRGHKK
jgi:hypothetical protein